MDKGTWIAIIALIVATAGLLAIQASIDSPAPAPSTSLASTTDNASTQINLSLLSDANNADCQTIATDAAQNEQAAQSETTSVISAHFDHTLQQCYYELDIFTAAGNETDLRVAPNDQNVASCTTDSSDTLTCADQNGSAITEPQFKALLTNYLGS